MWTHIPAPLLVSVQTCSLTPLQWGLGVGKAEQNTLLLLPAHFRGPTCTPHLWHDSYQHPACFYSEQHLCGFYLLAGSFLWSYFYLLRIENYVASQKSQKYKKHRLCLFQKQSLTLSRHRHGFLVYTAVFFFFLHCFTFIFMCMTALPASAWVPGAHGGQKAASDLLEL